MLFQQETLAFQLFDVLYLQQGYSKTRNKNRHYDALSFRIQSDTVIDGGSQKFHLHSGAITYFPSNCEYTRIAELDNLIVVHFKCFNFNGQYIESFTPNAPQEYDTLFRDLLACWNEKAPDYQYRCSSIFCNILSKIYLSNRPKTVSHSKIEPSLQYIRQNMLHQDFSLEAAAKKSFVSDVYFRKLFKEIYGISPKQYVIQNRILHAASLILSGYCSLQEVAERCGYRDYKHFSTEFKRITGTSPSQYEYNHWNVHPTDCVWVQPM